MEVSEGGKKFAVGRSLPDQTRARRLAGQNREAQWNSVSP
jgi:hypothetical protein